MHGFDWNRARAFLASAESGSFSAAARVLGLSQPTVGRQVAALEAELGVVLFERLGRSLRLTEGGEALLEPVRAMRRGATALELAAARQSDALAGVVRISASELIAARLLPAAIAELRRRHPSIEIDLLATSSVSDLARREADIAVRHFRPTEPELVCRKILDAAAGMYASTAYLDRIGRPHSLDDLAHADFIGFERSDTMTAALTDRGIDLAHARFPLVTGSSLVQLALAREGAGICFVETRIGDAEPGLEAVLPDAFALPVPIWLVCHRELRTARRFRVVFDALADALAQLG